MRGVLHEGKEIEFETPQFRIVEAGPCRRMTTRCGQAVMLLCVYALGASAMHCPATMDLAHGRAANLRLSGGGDTAPSLKDVAARRAELAKKAQKAEIAKEVAASSSWTILRVWFGITNKLRITGASTCVVDGKIVMSRNPVQKFFHFGEARECTRCVNGDY